MNYYLSRDYLASIQTFCGHCEHNQGHAHRALQEEDIAATYPLEAMRPCVDFINRAGGGYWGFAQFSYDLRAEILSHAIVYSACLEEALDIVYTYQRTVTNVLRFDLKKNLDGSVSSGVVLLAPMSNEGMFLMEANLAMGSLFLLDFLKEAGLVDQTEIGASENEVQALLAELNLARVSSSGNRRMFHFSRDLAALNVTDRDHRLLRLLNQQLERQVAQIPNPDSLAEQVESYVRHQLKQGVDLEDVCSHFHKSRRTLSRQLREEGTAFSEIRDRVRRKRAMELIDSRRIPVKRVAALSGFNSLAAFSRAFVSWTGQTPSEYRNSLSVG